jgi:hypothetical protein
MNFRCVELFRIEKPVRVTAVLVVTGWTVTSDAFATPLIWFDVSAYVPVFRQIVSPPAAAAIAADRPLEIVVVHGFAVQHDDAFP